MKRDDAYQIADELRQIAEMGFVYCTDDYDLERYRRIHRLSARLVSGMEDRSTEDVLDEYHGQFAHLSPLIGADAVVVRSNEVLLIQRTDDRLWAMPGGLVEVGETVAECAERELQEETGVVASAVQLLGVWDSRRVGSRTKTQLLHMAFLMHLEGEVGQLSATAETLAAQFFSWQNLPPLSPGHRVIVPQILDAIFNKPDRRPHRWPWFDR